MLMSSGDIFCVSMSGLNIHLALGSPLDVNVTLGATIIFSSNNKSKCLQLQSLRFIFLFLKSKVSHYS